MKIAERQLKTNIFNIAAMILYIYFVNQTESREPNGQLVWIKLIVCLTVINIWYQQKKIDGNKRSIERQSEREKARIYSALITCAVGSFHFVTNGLAAPIVSSSLLHIARFVALTISWFLVTAWVIKRPLNGYF